MEHRARDLETALWLVASRTPLMRALFLAADREFGPIPWYVGGGCVAQMVWNVRTGRPPLEHVVDVDVAYFDRGETTEDAEGAVAERLRAALAGGFGSGHDQPLPRLDAKNQARVHEWYEERFGVPIQPFRTLEAAIATWPTTATCVGLRRTEREMVVFAPYGLNDVFDLVVRPNKALVPQAVYEAKVERWRRCWPELTIVGW